ncbi:MAG TPA: methyl-accepting chemotaxis protein [Gemmatimonadaceae bacterium]|nr:methyl-accepting chemotaxis protein [Gemmatimonadaceae bacterium]
MPDKRKRSSMHHAPWRVALAASAPALVAILLIAWSGIRWIDGALAELPAIHAEAFRDIVASGVGLAAVVVLSLLVVAATVARRAADPVTLLAHTAERVAAGDLTVAFDESGEGEQVYRLHRALDEMIGALRRLVHAMRSASDETATMSAQITAGTEELSATASEFARTAGELSQEASRMSHAITLTAADSDQLMRVSARLDAGARDGVARNDSLAALARRSRERLDDSATAVTTLAAVAKSSATSAESVSNAAHEIGSFVTLVRRIARRAKLLSLNASMEAARAGEHGQGFGVVASELRALATTAAEASERTEAAVTLVLERVEQARESSRETVTTLGVVQHAQQEAHGSFAGIEHALDEGVAWLRTISDAATESGALLAKNNTRLAELAHGTASFASAMQQVAAGSEEQSAGAQEIAAASAALASASQTLQARVSAFRVSEG